MYSNIEEKFHNEKSLVKHHNKHSSEFDIDLTKEEYELLAEELQSKPVDNKNIFGYIGEYKSKQDNREYYYKYDKSTGVLVVYYYDSNDNPITVTCYTQSFRKFQSRKTISYLDEIPKGK